MYKEKDLCSLVCFSIVVHFLMKYVRREITPISNQDFYVLQNHFNAQFDYPLHYHPEFEINLVFNTSGKRLIGDAIENYGDTDLVLVGSNTLHAWTNDNSTSDARVITIQFATDFLNKQTLTRNVMQPIKTLLEKSHQGVLFTGNNLKLLKERILELAELNGFQGVLGFLSLLDEMANSSYQLILPIAPSLKSIDQSNNSRILEACYYIQNNYRKKIIINDVAQLVNMSPSTFSHFFKKRTYRSFTDYLIDLRISNACRLLIETDMSIANISEEIGFNNLSNFNKVFKKRKQKTPKEYRKIRLEVQMQVI